MTRGMSAIAFSPRPAELLAGLDSSSRASAHNAWIGGVRIDRRLNGPKRSANGGFAAGSIARQVDAEDFRRFDYMLAMDRANLSELQSRALEGARAKLALFMSFAPEAGNSTTSARPSMAVTRPIPSSGLNRWVR